MSRASMPRLVRTVAFAIPDGARLKPSTGNSAAVILNAERVKSEAALLALTGGAVHETTAVYRVGASNSEWRMRFWVPAGELSLCLHGVLGAVAALVRTGALLRRTCTIHTQAARLNVAWALTEGGVVVRVEQGQPIFGEPVVDPSSILSAVGLEISDLDPNVGPVQTVSAPRSKIFVPVRNTDAVWRAHPCPVHVAQICEAYEATGIYLFTRGTTDALRDIDARQFPANAGFVEDPATGVAAAGVAAYLVKHEVYRSSLPVRHGVFRYRIVQGEAMGVPCLLEGVASVRNGRVDQTSVCGRAAVLSDV